MRTTALLAMALLACWLAMLVTATAQEDCTNILTGEVVPHPGPYPICCPDPAVCEFQNPLSEEYRDVLRDWIEDLRVYVPCEYTNYIVYLIQHSLAVSIRG